MDQSSLKRILEGAILAAEQPLSLEQIGRLFGDEARPSNAELKGALEALRMDFSGRGFELKEVGSGWRFQVCEDLSPWVGRLWEEKPPRYSRALLETLALVAYRQPVTRGEIEEVRGVSVSSNIIRTLLEREWIRVVGHRDVPGKPAMYATTRQFLDYFNLKSLDQLPSLAELKDFDSLEPQFGFSPETVTVDAAEMAVAENQTTPPQSEDTYTEDEDPDTGELPHV